MVSNIVRALLRTFVGRQAIRERLGGNANMTELFPKRPKEMHHDTYMRLFWEHDEAEMAQLAGMREWIDRMEK